MQVVGIAENIHITYLHITSIEGSHNFSAMVDVTD